MSRFSLVCVIVVVLVGIYIMSLCVAYDKGYEKHRLEVLAESAKTVVNSQKDIITAGNKTKKVESELEKNKKKNTDCNTIMSVDISKCVPKF